MRLLITGAHGFIGASIGLFARAEGHDIIGVDRHLTAPDGWDGAYHALDFANNLATDDLSRLIAQADPQLVLHAAGAASVAASYDTPLEDLNASVMLWARLLDGVRRSGTSPLVVFPSSAAVYGNPVTLPVAETAAIAPISPYGFHKRACELLGEEYATCFGLNVAVVRLFSTYGPRQRRLLLWELFERAAGSDSEITLYGTGKESRDYLYIDDLARTILSLGAQTTSGYQLLNVASGSEITTAELAAQVAQAVGVSKPVRAQGGLQTGNPLNWCADISRLKQQGAAFSRSFADGLANCVEAWRA